MINYIFKPPLFIAIENENIEIIKLLLSCKKIDVNEFGYHLSQIDDYKSLDNLFQTDCIENIFKYEEEEKTLLCLAIEKENTEIVKLLLSNRYIDVNIKYFITIKQYNNIYDEKIKIYCFLSNTAIYCN